MATTDIYTVTGSLYPQRSAVRFLGGDTDDYMQVDADKIKMALNNNMGMALVIQAA
jgi:hypothetical protein|tara:strand:+ start:2836 stop:3003 length:168 start_codon:yes stop_codon:yes gene_type:complete